jgi:protein-S-isoprenylcysteine O-methyltransferase Ste14
MMKTLPQILEPAGGQQKGEAAMNQPPGLDVLTTKVPDLQTLRGDLRLLLIVAISFGIGAAFFGAFDDLFAGAPIVSQLIILLVGYALVGSAIWQRKRLRARLGEQAYRYAFWRFLATGLPLILTAIAHIAVVGGEQVVPFALAIAPCAYLFTTGVLLFARAVFTFGFDNLAMVYVYFPNEGRLVDSRIYSVLRHPVYSGVLRVALGLGLLRGTTLSLILTAIAPIGLWAWITFAEELELIERFGDGYRDYRRRVPAFFVWKPRGWGDFARFLVAGG